MKKHYKHFKEFYINIPLDFISDKGIKYLEKNKWDLKFDGYTIYFVYTPSYLKIFIKENYYDDRK